MRVNNQDLTQWYGRNTVPGQDGVYQIQTDRGTVKYAYWSKKHFRWFEPTDDMHSAVLSEYTTNASFPWRGLNKPFHQIMERDLNNDAYARSLPDSTGEMLVRRDASHDGSPAVDDDKNMFIRDDDLDDWDSGNMFSRRD